jgi:hydroxymethylpyrimidine/phosphomethylpyrimidine kinase
VNRRRVALTVAGSDSGGGAGVAADLKVFQAYGVWGTLALTAVTAQNTQGVQAVYPLPPDLVRAQIRSVASDMGVDAVKTGMLANAGIVRAVAVAVDELKLPRLVVDPVLAASHGPSLLDRDALAAAREELLPRAAVIAPNLPEAEALLNRSIRDRGDMESAAVELAGLGGPGAGLAVYLKGGHLPDPAGAPDLLLVPGSGPRWLEGPRLDQAHTHGTGCVLTAAIAAGLALGWEVFDACTAAKRFVTDAIAAGGGVGKGVGPVDPGAGLGAGQPPVS